MINNEISNEFLVDSFNPKSYLQTVLKPRIDDELDRIELEEQLTYIEQALRTLDSSMRREVTTHHEELLSHVSSSSETDRKLETIRTSVDAMEGSVARLKSSLSDRAVTVENKLKELQRVWATAATLRELSKFLAIVSKLDLPKTSSAADAVSASGPPPVAGTSGAANASKSTLDLPKEARLVAQAEALLASGQLQRISIVALLVPAIEAHGAALRVASRNLLHDAMAKHNHGNIGLAVSALMALGILQEAAAKACEKRRRATRDAGVVALNSAALSKLVRDAGAAVAPGDQSAVTRAERTALMDKVEEAAGALFVSVSEVAALRNVLRRKEVEGADGAAFLAVQSSALLERTVTSATDVFREKLLEIVRRSKPLLDLLVAALPRLASCVEGFVQNLQDVCGKDFDMEAMTAWKSACLTPVISQFEERCVQRLTAATDAFIARVAPGRIDDQSAASLGVLPAEAASLLGTHAPAIRALVSAISIELVSHGGVALLSDHVHSSVAGAIGGVCRAVGAAIYTGTAATSVLYEGVPMAQIHNAVLAGAVERLKEDVQAMLHAVNPRAKSRSQKDSTQPPSISSAASATLREALSTLATVPMAVYVPVYKAACQYVAAPLKGGTTSSSEVVPRIAHVRATLLAPLDQASSLGRALSTQMAQYLVSLFTINVAVARPNATAVAAIIADVAILSSSLSLLAGETSTPQRTLRGLKALLLSSPHTATAVAEVRSRLLHRILVAHLLLVHLPVDAVPSPCTTLGLSVDAYIGLLERCLLTESLSDERDDFQPQSSLLPVWKALSTVSSAASAQAASLDARGRAAAAALAEFLEVSCNIKALLRSA